MKFADVIGQEAVKKHLIHMVATHRLPHALLFCGPHGAGKLPLALAMARHLLCEHVAEGHECTGCHSCRMVDDWAHPDLHFSFPVYKRKSTDRPVSDDFLPQWRELLVRSPYFDAADWIAHIQAGNQQMVHYVYESDALQRKLSIKSNQGGRKVVVMWLPERMNEETGNKLLKLIEEPPQGTVFLMVSEEPERVLGTIVSRSQCIQVGPLAHDEVELALQLRASVPATQAQQIAHVAQGDFIRAMGIARGHDDADSQYFTLFQELMRRCYQRDIRLMRRWADEVAELGRERQKLMLDYFQRQLRENFMFNFRTPELSYLTPPESRFSQNFARFIHERNVMDFVSEFATAQRDVGQNVNARMVFFCLAMRTAILIRR